MGASVAVDARLNRRICVFGAPADTGNLGVNALSEALLDGIAARLPSADVTVFDHGWGMEEQRAPGSGFVYTRCGARTSKRYHRPEAFANMRLSALAGGVANPGARRLLQADGVFDVSGGDSFSDIYGSRRFDAVNAPKRLALAHRVPLVLLPQTYGPFSSRKVEQEAVRLVRGARAAWARDERSFDALKRLVGHDYDPARHRAGVDLAVLLVPRRPDGDLRSETVRALDGRGRPLVGLNVSGLLYNDPGAQRRFGLAMDYRGVVRTVLRRFLEQTDANIVLVPHVCGSGEMDDDVVAQEQLVREFGAVGGRLRLLPWGLDAGQTKWAISQLDWFCGSRMHATIAALSSGVPTATIAYSGKSQGVFDSFGLGNEVVDGRVRGAEEVLAAVDASWTRRKETQTRLARSLPRVLARAEEQLDDILELVASAPQPTTPGPGRRTRR